MVLFRDKMDAVWHLRVCAVNVCFLLKCPPSWFLLGILTTSWLGNLPQRELAQCGEIPKYTLSFLWHIAHTFLNLKARCHRTEKEKYYFVEQKDSITVICPEKYGITKHSCRRDWFTTCWIVPFTRMAPHSHVCCWKIYESKAGQVVDLERGNHSLQWLFEKRPGTDKLSDGWGGMLFTFYLPSKGTAQGLELLANYSSLSKNRLRSRLNSFNWVQITMYLVTETIIF